MRLLSVDPGLRSGWAFWDGALITGIDDPMPTISLFHVLQTNPGLDVVVCEAYRISERTAKLSAQHWSLEIIGALRYLCWSSDVEFVLQTPAEAKSFVPDARLRAMDMWTPGKEDHARDATRHLVLALAKRGAVQVPVL